VICGFGFDGLRTDEGKMVSVIKREQVDYLFEGLVSDERKSE
jgi:hypothetical protein